MAAFVSAVTQSLGTGLTDINAPAQNVAAGGALIVFINNYHVAGGYVEVDTIADTAGNTFVPAGAIEHADGSNDTTQCFIAGNTVANAANVVMAEFAASTDYPAMVVLHYDGPLEFGAQSTLTLDGSNTTSHATGNLTTTQVNELVLGYFRTYDGTPSGYTASGGSTERADDNGIAGQAAFDKVAATAGSYNVASTTTNSNIALAMARSFRTPGGGSAVDLAGAATAQGAATAAMTHGVPLQGAATGAASASAALSVSLPAVNIFGRHNRPGRGPYSLGRYYRRNIDAFTPRSYADLAGTAAGQATATGAISLGVTLAGASIAQATSTGAITHGVPLAGSAVAAAAANGSLSITVTLQGAALAQATAGGSLDLRIDLAGNALAQVAATADMTHGVPLVGSALAAANATGALLGEGLAGSAAGQSAATGQLSLSVALSAAAVAQAVASGALSITVNLSVDALAQAIATGSLNVPVTLSGAAGGQASATGALYVLGLGVFTVPPRPIRWPFRRALRVIGLFKEG